MLEEYTAVADGTTEPQDDTTDRLYSLREFLSETALVDCGRYADRFSQSNLAVDILKEFDRFLEGNIDTYSAFDDLPLQEIKTILEGIERLGNVYSNLQADYSGSDDNGMANVFEARVKSLNTEKEYFVHMMANLPLVILTDEVALRHE